MMRIILETHGWMYIVDQTHRHEIVHYLCRFPSDINTYEIERQFLWGSALLVTPVLEENSTSVKGYFPPGRWFDYYRWYFSLVAHTYFMTWTCSWNSILVFYCARVMYHDGMYKLIKSMYSMWKFNRIITKLLIQNVDVKNLWEWKANFRHTLLSSFEKVMFEVMTVLGKLT